MGATMGFDAMAGILVGINTGPEAEVFAAGTEGPDFDDRNEAISGAKISPEGKFTVFSNASLLPGSETEETARVTGNPAALLNSVVKSIEPKEGTAKARSPAGDGNLVKGWAGGKATNPESFTPDP